MSTDNRFKNMNTSPLPTNNRWKPANPFQSSNREGNSSNRFSSNREGNSSNRFPKPSNDRWKREDTKERPFRNSFRGRRPRAPRQSHFKRYDSPAPKPIFLYKEDDFPSLSTKNTKIADGSQQLNFKNAAEKGEKCVTPPPRPPLSPPARLSRPRKKDDDERSLGWDTDDEKAAREADPSDDEEDPDIFW